MAQRHTSNLSPRFQAAIDIRDAVQSLLVAGGTYTEKPCGARYRYSVNGLMMSHRIPIPEVLRGQDGVWRVHYGHPIGNLAFGLEIWADEKKHKVLNVEWERDYVDLVSFKRGSWEQRALDLEGAASELPLLSRWRAMISTAIH